MIHVLTEKSSKDGWGKPIGVFDNKEDLKNFIVFDFKKRYSDAKDIVVNSIDRYNKVELKIESLSRYGGCKLSGGYEVYSFQRFNPERSSSRIGFFDE